MKQFLTARAAKLLEELNNVPLTDQCDEIKLKLMLAAMRETSIEMFSNAAENARKDIAKIQADALAEDIQAVEDDFDTLLIEVITSSLSIIWVLFTINSIFLSFRWIYNFFIWDYL